MNGSDLKVLIIKTSSLGDIVQAFGVIDFLKQVKVKHIDWVVEKEYEDIISSHSSINKAITFDFRSIKKRKFSFKDFFSSLKILRQEKYDLIIDLQGNCKSGFITFLAKGMDKLGFALKNVREWPNILATNVRYTIDKKENIRVQYIRLISNYFNTRFNYKKTPLLLKIKSNEREFINELLKDTKFEGKLKIMVCIGAKWPSKQLNKIKMGNFLYLLEKKYKASFIFVWGNTEEKDISSSILSTYNLTGIVLKRKLSIAGWQNLINMMDLSVVMDSSSLHLCGMSASPSFSIFGPTSSKVFKPIGDEHFAFQGKCSLGIDFEKICPNLRTCKGHCMNDIKVEDLFLSFSSWWNRYIQTQKV
jgi:heptosyltransferase I